jgi:hypothetical protein
MRFTRWVLWSAPVTGSCGGLCGEDRDFNASCQRRMCRQYFAGWAGRLILRAGAEGRTGVGGDSGVGIRCPGRVRGCRSKGLDGRKVVVG